MRGRPNIVGIDKGLGPLELRVVSAISRLSSPITVRDVCEAMEAQDYFAYQGVLNSLNRLARKGVLRRKRAGRAYQYLTLVDPEGVIVALLREVLGWLREDDDRVLARALGMDPEAGAKGFSGLRRKYGKRSAVPAGTAK